jgi:O-acetyl-ADP-ribose deacetylase (regulator of RNase III)
MPTAITKGDIFETEGIHAYAFGANIDGTMDVGIAIAMKKRWPELAEAFAARCAGNKLNLGDVFVWTPSAPAAGTERDQSLTVFALAIRNGEKKASMSALTHAVRRMLTLAAEAKVKRIGLPRIGGGPDGLDWTRVRKMLGEISVGQGVRLDVFEQFVRNKDEK